MADAGRETEDISDKLQTMDITKQKVDSIASKTGEKCDTEYQSGAQTSLDPAVKLKRNLKQKSKNLSARDKAKIAEMVKGLAIFKHAEQEVEVESKKTKGKMDGEAVSKAKKEKIKEVEVEIIQFKDDEWEDIDSDEDVGQEDNIVAHVDDKRTYIAQTKSQKSPKVGCYTKLLQSVGGRRPDMQAGSGPNLKSAYVEESVSGNQSEKKMSAKERRSKQRLEAHHLKMQELTLEDSERQSVQTGSQGPDGGNIGVKLSHKEQAKQRSEIHKLKQQSQDSERSRSPEYQGLCVPVQGGMFHRTVAQDDVVPHGMMSQQHVLVGNEQGNQISDTKGKKKKKKKQEQISALSPKVSPQPQQTKPTIAPGPAVFDAQASVAQMSEVKIKVQKSDHRFIVGQQRKNLQEIYNLTGVTIEVPRINDDSEEITLRGDKFQIGPAITLMYTKCEVSRAEVEQKQIARGILQAQNTQIPVASEQFIGQGQGQQRQVTTLGQQYGQGPGLKVTVSGQCQPRPGSGQGKGLQYQDSGIVQGYSTSQAGDMQFQTKFKEFDPYKNKPRGSKGQGQRSAPQNQSQGQRSAPQNQGQGQRSAPQNQGQGQRSAPQNQRQKSGQGHGQDNQRGMPQGQGQGNQAGKKSNKGQGQGQNKKQAQQNKQKKKKSKHDKQVEIVPTVCQPTSKLLKKQPLLCDSVWLQQGKYEAGEALYHKFLAGKSQSKGAKKQRKKVFDPYWSMEDISHGLKRGVLIQGTIRINPKNFEEAYVPHPDGKSDILLCSFIERNRALNGDTVAVLLKEEGDWKVHKEELQHLESKHASFTSGPGESTEGGNADNNEDDDVKIESEEIIVTETIENSATKVVNEDENRIAGAQKEMGSVDSSKDGAKAGNQTQGQGEQSKGSRSPNKALQRYHNLNDVLAAGSPVAKRMFRFADNEADTEMVAQARKLLVRTGKVVAIIEKKHTRACTGTIRPLQDKNPNRALFAPSDYRLPRLLIPMDDCPKGLNERPEDFARTLYVARIIDWKDDSKMAFGRLARSLGEAGEIEPETEGMLIENGVDFDEFPQQALDCLPSNLPWSIPESEFEYRKDFRDSCIFTIDPATARDLDDALSCEELGDGRYKVGVHIADVSWFIDEGTVLDRVASLRATSVYLVHKVIPMLPRLLCEQLCSLNPDEDRLAFSVEWIISESGEIEDEWFGRSVIRSCVKLSYDHAQGFIEQPDRDWAQEELPPISERFCVEDIKTRVLNLHKIARNLRKSRFDGGCLRLDQVKLQYSLDPETGLPNGYWVYQQKESNSLVEEFMLLANMAVAHRINMFYPDKALLRRHPPPQEKMLENLKDQCEALGLHLDTSGAGQLQRSLWRYYDDDEYSLARMQVLVSLCSKPMQNAKYFCTGCIDDESLYHHYALNVPLYTHFTSPIRRYPDVIVHRLLGATLDYCEETSKSPQELHKLAEHCNDKKTAAKRCSDLSSELFFAVFVKVAGPLEEKAMVMAVFDKSFDIFILRLGVSKRVYCDKLDIKEKNFVKDKKVASLTLVWNVEDDRYTAGEGVELRQVITIFSVVDCVLKQGELPLQWTAIIKKPVQTDYLKQLEIQDQEVVDDNTSDTEEMTAAQVDMLTDEQQDTQCDKEAVTLDHKFDNSNEIFGEPSAEKDVQENPHSHEDNRTKTEEQVEETHKHKDIPKDTENVPVEKQGEKLVHIETPGERVCSGEFEVQSSMEDQVAVH